MRRLNDPVVVRDEYATEVGLASRRAAYFDYPTTGPDALAIAVAAVAEVAAEDVLEVGCGMGQLAERIAQELAAHVTALDLSPRMVELTRERGIDALVGDAQELPFESESFDCAVAAWMLYHVPDVDRALGELVRVLRARGRLIAITNDVTHLTELRQLVGHPPTRGTAFSGANGAALLRRHFPRVERRDAGGTITFPDREAVRSYVRASITLADAEVPEDVPEPLVVTRYPVVFVADKA